MIYSDHEYIHVYIPGTLVFGGLTFKNEGHRGSRLYIVYILIGHNLVGGFNPFEKY